nr:MAG TPA: hypothetical protein [Caudoviricetes sp.]DAN34920.1 MAG TPA: hypothetical protein [Caudoviricetes sp.]
MSIISSYIRWTSLSLIIVLSRRFLMQSLHILFNFLCLSLPSLHKTYHT